MTIIEFLRKYYKTHTRCNLSLIRPRVKCTDGFTMSVQASSNHYCIPREDGEGYYSAVEVGFPSETEPGLFEYGSNDDVYGFVPIDVVQEICDKHGGIVGADFSNVVAGYWTEEERSGK